MRLELNTKNLKRICGLNGMTVVGLCHQIGRHRDTIYKALRVPNHFRPTLKLINAKLPRREVPRV